MTNTWENVAIEVLCASSSFLDSYKTIKLRPVAIERIHGSERDRFGSPTDDRARQYSGRREAEEIGSRIRMQLSLGKDVQYKEIARKDVPNWITRHLSSFSIMILRRVKHILIFIPFPADQTLSPTGSRGSSCLDQCLISFSLGADVTTSGLIARSVGDDVCSRKCSIGGQTL
jgi:hypothetical protein